MKPPLSTACLVAAPLGASLAALFAYALRELLRHPGADPSMTVFVMVLAALTAVQAIPMAGLPAWLLSRYGSPELAAQTVVWVTVWLTLLATVFLGAPALLLGAPLALAAVFSVQLAASRRPWVIAWAVGSVAALGVGLVAAVVLLSLPRPA